MVTWPRVGCSALPPTLSSGTAPVLASLLSWLLPLVVPRFGEAGMDHVGSTAAALPGELAQLSSSGAPSARPQPVGTPSGEGGTWGLGLAAAAPALRGDTRDANVRTECSDAGLSCVRARGERGGEGRLLLRLRGILDCVFIAKVCFLDAG